MNEADTRYYARRAEAQKFADEVIVPREIRTNRPHMGINKARLHAEKIANDWLRETNNWIAMECEFQD